MAAAYLDAALTDGDKQGFLFTVRNVAEANLGSIGELAEISGLNREQLYKILSENGNPVYDSLDKILHSLGLRLSVKKDDEAAWPWLIN